MAYTSVLTSANIVPAVRRDNRISTSSSSSSSSALVSSGSSTFLYPATGLVVSTGSAWDVPATGTSGYIPYWNTTGTSLLSSIIFANSTAVFVGYSADPTSGNKLAVNGATYLGGALTVTGTVTGVTSTMVGLGSVNNTSDTAKPVSTAQQTALNLKANIASPTFTGTVTIPTLASPSVAIQFSGVTKWTLTADTTGLLQFKNASGVLEAQLSQTGALQVKGEVSAFATI